MRKIVLLLLWTSTLIFAQLSVKNQSELTYWETDENWILENWLEAGYQVADLEFGLRLDIFNPPANYIYDVTRLREEMDNYHPGYWFAAYMPIAGVFGWVINTRRLGVVWYYAPTKTAICALTIAFGVGPRPLKWKG
jgi:hypothetical protein